MFSCEPAKTDVLEWMCSEDLVFLYECKNFLVIQCSVMLYANNKLFEIVKL